MITYKNFLKESTTIENIKGIDKIVSSLGPSNSTTVFEACVAIIAMNGGKLSGSFSMKYVSQVPDMHPKAEEFFKKFFNQNKTHKDSLEFMNQWINTIGGAVDDLAYEIEDVIFGKVDSTYKKRAPSSFQVAGAGKDNTADIVLVTLGTGDNLMSLLDEISTLPHNKQVSRVSTEKDGHITIKDKNGEVGSSYYQVSLKKSVDDARVGKTSTFVLRSVLGLDKKSGVVQPSDASKVQKSFKSESIIDVDYLDESILDFIKRGVDFVADLPSKIVDIVSRGLGDFLTWSGGLFSKLTSSIKKTFVIVGNKRLKKDKNLNAISSLMSSVGLHEQKDVDCFFDTLNEKKGDDIPIIDSIARELDFIAKDFLGKNRLNQLMNENVSKISKLNKLQDVKSKRVVDPFVFKGKIADNLLDPTTRKRLITKISDILSKGNKKTVKTISREEFSELLKIAMNYSANVVMGGIIDTLSSSVIQKNYQTLTDALLALSASFVGEAKFGNTALPLVIIYGGKSQKLQVLGKRDNFEKNMENNLKKAQSLPNYPIAAFRLNKVSGKSYNTVGFFLLSDFESSGKEPPTPIWIQFSMATSSGSSFSFKIEGESYVKKIN